MFKSKINTFGKAAFLVIIIFVTSCHTIMGPPTILPSSEIIYDNQPDVVVIHVDIHYPGLPMPTTSANDCYRTFLPTLRIWGDGLVFFNENWSNVERSAVLSGRIGADTLKGLLEYLNSQHFFTAWEVMGPNPAGTSLKIGAHLKGRPAVEYETGDLEPVVYVKLINTLKPELTSISQQSTIDIRIESILKDYMGCNQ